MTGNGGRPEMQPACATLLFTGDVYLTDGRTDSLFADELAAFADAHTLRICNFEGAGYAPGAKAASKEGPSLMQGEHAAHRVRASGFDLVSLANNHMMDYGVRGLCAALDSLAPLRCMGAGETVEDAYRPLIVEGGGMKLGFLAAAERQFGMSEAETPAGVAWLFHPMVETAIRTLRETCDHVIVLPHAGLENADVPLPEWRDAYRRLIDLGASVIVGSHPHVLQGVERYRGGLIFYSLGNFAFTRGKPAYRTAIASVQLEKGKTPEGTLLPVIWENGEAEFDHSPEAAARLGELDRLLTDGPAYRAAVNAACETYDAAFGRSYIIGATGYVRGGALTGIKNAVKRLIRWRGGERVDERRLYAILSNETISWTMARSAKNRWRAETPEGGTDGRNP